MITIVVGTNRPNSKSALISKELEIILNNAGETCQILNMDMLDSQDFDHEYEGDKLSDNLIAIQERYIFPIEKMIYVIPEYNGGVPGVLKYFIDSISVREYARNFNGKKALLIGVSAGRGGNSRGLEAFTGVLNYLSTHVFPTKLPLSSISSITDDNGLTDSAAKENLKNLLEKFIAY